MPKFVQHIKGFTTMELSIVMLLTSVVASLAYGGYSMLQKQFFANGKTTQEALDINTCLYLIKKDVNNCYKIENHATNLCFYYEKDTVIYSYETTSFILRKQNNIVDTFNLALENVSFVRVIPNAQAPIVQFSANMNYKNAITPLHFEKNYDTKTLLELTHGN